jgi:tRNA(fMet)-specific endonuclease VapC
VSGWLLDTNIASHVVRGDRPELRRKLTTLNMTDIAVSVVTEGELLFGLAKRNYPPALSERVRRFLIRVKVLDWDRDVVRGYANLRASCEAIGIGLSPLDMMIAAQAVAADTVLVTRDKAFAKVPHLRTEQWAAP